MPATRTQVYLTVEQRRKIDAVAARDGVRMADVVRAAIDHYLGDARGDPEAALRSTFGVDPEIAMPSRNEWDPG